MCLALYAPAATHRTAVSVVCSAVTFAPANDTQERSVEDVGSDSTWHHSAAVVQAEQMDCIEPLSINLLDEQLDIDVRTLWLATMTDSSFSRAFHGQRQYQQVKRGHWRSEGQCTLRLLR